jgi:hypothetical protein
MAVSKRDPAPHDAARAAKCRAPARTRLAVERLEDRRVMATTTGHMAVGMNLENIVDWSPAWTFTDVFEASRGWITHAVNTATGQMTWDVGATHPVRVDGDGNVTGLSTFTNAAGQTMRQMAGTLMFRELGGAYPGGTYRAEWQGTGRVTFGMDARVTATGRTAAGTNYADLAVTPGDGGIYLRIEETSVSDPVRDFSVWMPDWQGRSFVGERWRPGETFSPFHPLFLERLAPFSVIRFMQAQETNTSDIRTWGDRRDARDIRQSSGIEGSSSEPLANGMSVEHMVQLANDLDADPWFNMPHQADDHFVRNFATYVRDHLEPGRRAHVEWSNEIWNFAWGFEATQWVAEQTQLPENAGLSHWQIAGREARRDLDIWTDVFAGQTHRLVRIAGGFAANDWVTERIVESMAASFDAIAIAPYFSPTEAQRAGYSATTTVDRVLDDTQANIAVAAGFATAHGQLAQEWSTRLGREIALFAYEGGHHLDAHGAAYQDVFHAAANHPRMGDLYREYLRALDETGMDLYADFTFTGQGGASPWGDFAKLHRMDEPIDAAWRYQAVVAAADGSLWDTDSGMAPIEQAGSVALATDGGGFLRANGTLLAFNGGPVNYQQLVAAGWTPMAADIASGINTVILRHTSGYIHFWRLDTNWQQVSGDGWFAPGSPQFFAAEIAFGIDLDDDSVVGPTLTPIEQAGSVALATDGGGSLRANGTLINFNGGPANYQQLVAAGWTPMAADVASGVNTVILRHTSGYLHFWRLDAGWQQVSGDGWVAPGSPQFFTTEIAFGVDLDGNLRVGS